MVSVTHHLNLSCVPHSASRFEHLARASQRGLFFWRLLEQFEVRGTGSRFEENRGIKRLSERLPRPFAVAAMARYTADSRNNHPGKHTGCPKKAPRSIESRFHISYSEPTVFLIILFIISANLPVRGGFTYAMPPYNPHLSYGLSTARSNPPTVLKFPRFRSWRMRYRFCP